MLVDLGRNDMGKVRRQGGGGRGARGKGGRGGRGGGRRLDMISRAKQGGSFVNDLPPAPPLVSIKHVGVTLLFPLCLVEPLLA